MTRLFILLIMLLATNTAIGETSLQCDSGPLEKYFGGTKWFVYSCPDNDTLVIYSYPDSQASPFYFMSYKKDGAYQLYGEGTGSQTYTKAAADELGKYVESDIRALIVETKSVKNNER